VEHRRGTFQECFSKQFNRLCETRPLRATLKQARSENQTGISVFFPLCYDEAMKVPDEAVLAVIDELRRSRVRVTGARVRRELHRRYGARGGVARIYRLLDAPPPASAVERNELERALADRDSQIDTLTAECQRLRDRVNLAEFREQATQDRTALEIHQLRERLRVTTTQAPRPADSDKILQLYRELHLARERIAQLEAQLV
jgi:hypothetical protein